MSPTLEQIEAISTRLRVGAFERVAVESAGVAWPEYQKWSRLEGRPDCPVEIGLLVDAVRQARADARLQAEMDLRKSDPKTWLMYGPGRQTAVQEGWGPADKAGGSSANDVRGEMMELAAVILGALDDEPAARMKAAAVVTNYSCK